MLPDTGAVCLAVLSEVHSRADTLEIQSTAGDRNLRDLTRAVEAEDSQRSNVALSDLTGSVLNQGATCSRGPPAGRR